MASAKSSRVFAFSILVVCGAADLGTVAHAQEPIDEVTVTGSRIARRDFSALSPIMTVDAAALENSSTVSIESVLNQYPQFVPDGTQFDAGNIEPSAFETPGISSVNLRGLGSSRNLVLVDGRRLQPANATLTVDVGTIPSAAIRRVEAITGGASSVYGADAISGVVNFVLRDDFEGIDIDLQTGVTQEGDGEESRFSVLVGGNSADGKANLMVGIEWSERKAVYQADRDFIVEGWNDPGTTTGAVAATYWSCGGPTGGGCPTQAAVNQVFGDVAAAGTVSPTSDTLINPDGTVFKNAVPTGAFTARGALSYTGPLAPTRKIMTFQNDVVGESNQDGYSSSPLERASLFGRAIYDLTDNVRAFIQGNYSQVEVDSVGPWTLAIVASAATIPHGTGIYAPSLNATTGATLPQFLPGGAVGVNCPPTGGCTNSQAFPVPPELAFLLDQRAQPNNSFQLQRYLNFMPSRATNNRSNVYQLQTGVEGTLRDGDWTWEAYISHGETTIDSYLNEGWASDQRYKQVAQAPNFGRGFTQTSATGALGFNIRCTTGLPLMAEFTPSDDCIDAIDARMKQFTRLEQTIVEANMQGGIVEMRSGELRFAAGVSNRENTALFEPDPLVDAQSTRDNPIGLFPQNETSGETDVSEIYGELLIPVFDSLDFELGYRYSDYDQEGGIDTYKALFDWAATDSFRVRGGRQVANRAPNVAERFTGPSQNVVAFQGADPCLANTLHTWGNHPSNPNRAQVQALCSAIINAPPGQPSLWDQAPNTYTGPFPFVFQLEVEERRGNADVRSEEAETYTLGAVFQRERWSASLDFYTIDIKDAIAPPDAYFVYNRCFNGAGTNPSYSIDDPEGFCRLIVRDPISGYRVQVNTLYRNLGALETDGVDLQLNWRGDIGANGVFVNFLASYVDSYKLQQQPGGAFVEYAGTLGAGGQYDYRTFTTFGYDFDNVNLGLRWTHLPEVENAVFATNPNTTVLPTSSYDRFDLFGRWSPRETIELRFGIDNLADADPEIVGANPGQTNAMGLTNTGFYDILGRRYYLGVNFSF